LELEHLLHHVVAELVVDQLVQGVKRLLHQLHLHLKPRRAKQLLHYTAAMLISCYLGTVG
jgi:hypothetical protein